MKLDKFQSNFAGLNSKLNLIYTFTLFLGNFGFGFCVAIYGAAFFDLAKVYQIDQSQLYLVLIGNGIGYAVGTLFGLLYKWFNRQLTIITSTLVLAVTTACSPYYAPLPLAYVMLTLEGFSMGVFGSSYQIWFLQMWPNKINTVLQVNQFMFGFGSIAAPTISAYCMVGMVKEDVPLDMRMQGLFWPFLLAGVVTAIASIILLVLYIIHPYHEEIRESATTNATHDPTSTELAPSRELLYPTSRVPLSHRTGMLIFCCVFFAIYYSAENGYLPYATNMWQQFGLHTDEANFVMTVLSICYTIGPLVTAFVAIKLTPDHILMYHYVIIIAGYVMMFAGKSNIWLIYTGSGVLGYGFSVMQGSIFSFVNRHFELTDFVTSVYLFISGTAATSFSILMYYFPLNRQPNVMFYLLGFYIGVSLCCFVVIKLIILCLRK